MLAELMPNGSSIARASSGGSLSQSHIYCPERGHASPRCSRGLRLPSLGPARLPQSKKATALQQTSFVRTRITVSELPNCPQCAGQYAYEEGPILICPSCGHEWSPSLAAEDDGNIVRDAHGNVLQSGDSVIVIKDLKVKGSSLVVKGGTKVKNIRLVDGDHDIDCKIDGIGAMQLKSEFLKKA